MKNANIAHRIGFEITAARQGGETTSLENQSTPQRHKLHVPLFLCSVVLRLMIYLVPERNSLYSLEFLDLFDQVMTINSPAIENIRITFLVFRKLKDETFSNG